MFPMLVAVHPRHARQEERMAQRDFGRAHMSTCGLLMAWIPKFFQSHCSNLKGDQNEHYR